MERMKTRNAFQFNASPATPAFLHRTEMEIIEFCNARFRNCYEQLADAVLDHARNQGLTTVVELGAGCAPITQRLAADERAAGVQFVVCDLIPNREAFHELERRFPGRVSAIYEPVDFSVPRDWGPQTLLVLSAAFHHVPVERRTAALQALCNSAGGVMIFATVRKTVWCMFCACFVLVPALLLPLGLLERPGRLRRCLWCWVVPLAPLMMLWDGVGGCLRHWTACEWRAAGSAASLSRELTVRETWNSQTVIC
jgi:hypothetical protein